MDGNLQEVNLLPEMNRKLKFPQRNGLSKSKFSKHSDPDSQLIVSVNRTPKNLTPSQRLQLRKLRINQSITELKHGGGDEWHKFADDIDNEDEEIGDGVDIFTVPVCQHLSSLHQKEKFTFVNEDRKFSLATETT